MINGLYSAHHRCRGPPQPPRCRCQRICLVSPTRHNANTPTPPQRAQDIHGQFYDLINLFELNGWPGSVSEGDEDEANAAPGGGPTGHKYCFLGDYVDRGQYSCEVMLLLMMLKLAAPEHMFLLRGNHECETVSTHFGFKEGAWVLGLDYYTSTIRTRVRLKLCQTHHHAQHQLLNVNLKLYFPNTNNLNIYKTGRSLLLETRPRRPPTRRSLTPRSANPPSLQSAT